MASLVLVGESCTRSTVSDPGDDMDPDLCWDRKLHPSPKTNDDLTSVLRIDSLDGY